MISRICVTWKLRGFCSWWNNAVHILSYSLRNGIDWPPSPQTNWIELREQGCPRKSWVEGRGISWRKNATQSQTCKLVDSKTGKQDTKSTSGWRSPLRRFHLWKMMAREPAAQGSVELIQRSPMLAWNVEHGSRSSRGSRGSNRSDFWNGQISYVHTGSEIEPLFQVIFSMSGRLRTQEESTSPPASVAENLLNVNANSIKMLLLNGIASS